MAAGTATTHGSQGENITHFGAVRFRIVGAGNLKLRWLSLDEVHESQMADLAMLERTDIEPRVLGNFMTQRAQLEVKTTEINEFFRINRIILFVRPTYVDYPG